MRNAGGGADARTSQALVRPRSSGNWSFPGIREFRRIAASDPGSGTPAQKFEGRNPQGTKARGNDPRRPRGRTACCPAGIRSVGVSGSRIVLEKDGSVLEFPKQPTHASGSSPRKRPLLRKPEKRKTTGPYPPAYRHEQRFSTDRQKQSRRTTVGSQRTKMAEQKSAWAASRSVAANGYPVPQRSRGGRYGTKLGSFTSRRPDEGKIAIILSWYVSCI